MKESETFADLLNLGARSVEMLAAAGIYNRNQLEKIGPVKAYLATKQAGANPSMNLLWAIAGALTNNAWNKLPQIYKDELQKELNKLTLNDER